MKGLDEGIIDCGFSTFKHYAIENGWKKKERKKKSENKKGFRATAVFEHLHIDTTYLPTVTSGIQKIIMLRDNFSKAILHHLRVNVHTNLNSKLVAQVLEEAFQKYNLYDRTHEINIVSDGGPENKKEVNTWVANIKAPPCVKKLTHKTEAFSGSNSMIEDGFHLLKHDYLKGEMPYDEKDCDKKLALFYDFIGNRYFGELHGETPYKVLAGAIPDKHRFKDKIKIAQKERVITNKAFEGCPIATEMPTCV